MLAVFFFELSERLNGTFFYLKINTHTFSALIDPRNFATFQVLVSYTTSKNSQSTQLSVIANRKKKLIFFL